MSFKCLVGLHTWNGCKCSECGKHHDKWHTWEGCICIQCGKCRDEQHNWSTDCDECHVCGKTRVNYHDWSIDCEKCSKCGKRISNAHKWNGCKCLKCGKTLNEGHVWHGCKCLTCGKSRDEEHNWSKNCEECLNCGKIRADTHVWENSICSNCGFQKVEIIYFEQERPSGDALCSWDPCPCEGSGSVIPKGEGYLFIPETSVEFRSNCLTSYQYQMKLQVFSMLSPSKSLIFTDVPVLVCHKGIGRLNIDPIVAREDAKYWWATGMIPLRASPKRR